MTLAIDVQNVQRVYGSGQHAVHALQDVTLPVAQGQFVALKGRSGSGKTTLLNCIGGLDRPTGGTIHVMGADVPAMSERALTRWRQTEVGFIFQAHGLLPTLSAYENVELMLRLGRLPRRARKQRALDSLELVGLSDYRDQRPYELSGGQAQRVAIARALALRPKVILADEATGELDTATTYDMLNLLHGLVKRENMTILLATHDDLVDSYVDRVVHLADGKIVAGAADAPGAAAS